jgi:hypothetical protein
MAMQPVCALTVTLSSTPVDCFENFAMKAAFTTSTQNTKAEFYVDDYLFATKNPMGSPELSVRYGMGFGDWDRLRAGTHKAEVRLYSLGGVPIDSGQLQFQIAGRRCPEVTTTTILNPPRLKVNCTSNNDCGDAVAESPYCADNAVHQLVRWGECAYPGTSRSICIDSQDEATLEVCGQDTECAGGKCIPAGTSSTVSQTTSTSQTTTTTAAAPSASSSSTTSSSTTSTTVMFKRTNTKLDRLVALLEDFLSLILGG